MGYSLICNCVPHYSPSPAADLHLEIKITNAYTCMQIAYNMGRMCMKHSTNIEIHETILTIKSMAQIQHLKLDKI